LLAANYDDISHAVRVAMHPPNFYHYFFKVSKMPILERISSAVPWPRGIAWYDEKLVVLARGAHRKQGGPQVDDQAGTLFEVSAEIAEEVSPNDTDVGSDVLQNAKVFARPSDPPFKLWQPSTQPAHLDTRTDRPYATLHWDPATTSFYICAFAGIDLPSGEIREGLWPFWPNSSCGVHRFDVSLADSKRLTNGEWLGVEAHRFDNVPEHVIRRFKDGASSQVPNSYYPHHAIESNSPPHGLLNGPDGLFAVGKYLYCVGLDNNKLAQYDISTKAEFPPSRIVPVPAVGSSAVAAFGPYIYFADRQARSGGAKIIRYSIDPQSGQILDDDGYPFLDSSQPITPETIARMDYVPTGAKRPAHIIDIDFDSTGALYVSMATGSGKIWYIPDPSPDELFLASEYWPYLDLQELSPNPRAKCADICFDDDDNLYICSGNKDTERVNHHGTIYRAIPD